MRAVLVLPPVASAHAPLPLVHEERVRTERAELAGEARRHPRLHHEDEDHGHDADGDPADGQERPQLVRDEREGCLDDGVTQLRQEAPQACHGRAPACAARSAAWNCASASAPSASAFAAATSLPGPSAITSPSSSPTVASASTARSRRSLLPTPRYTSGSSTFSSADARGRSWKLWKTNPISRLRTSASWSSESVLTSRPESR